MMNTISRVAVFAILFTALSAFTIGFQTIKIQTSAVCGMCKDRIEGTLNTLEGVEEARLDMTTKKVKIKYDDTKQSEASLKAIITKLGYSADNLPASETAFEALPGCCKSEKACASKTASVEGAKAKSCASKTANAEGAKAKSCAKGAKGGDACCSKKASTTAANASKGCCSGDKAKSCSKKKVQGTMKATKV